jgi:hypothetical protein
MIGRLRCAARGVARGVGHRRSRCARGQATVELVGIMPFAALVALAAGQLLAAGAAGELAGHAAQAGAVAIVQGLDPRTAARDALPGWTARRVDVRVRDREVRVEVRPVTLIPGLADELAATATADAGPVR